jgi:3-hydroxyisobutyrate dehydrogenase
MTDNSSKPVCGFIGLGSQGAPIAKRIIDAGYPMRLWARRGATLEPFRDTPASFAPSIMALAQAVDHVGICVLDDDGVLEVCDALIPAMRPGSRLVIHSTTLPQTCKAVAEQAGSHAIAFLEAPVSGGAPGAQAGTMTIMAAGDPSVLASVRPIFETFARTIIHLGGVGTAQAAKLINNSLMAANMGLAHSAIAAGSELGIDPAMLARLLQESSGRSFALEVYAKQRNGGFPHAASLVDKVRLLGEVIGPDHPTIIALRNAAAAMLGTSTSE